MILWTLQPADLWSSLLINHFGYSLLGDFIEVIVFISNLLWHLWFWSIWKAISLKLWWKINENSLKGSSLSCRWEEEPPKSSCLPYIQKLQMLAIYPYLSIVKSGLTFGWWLPLPTMNIFLTRNSKVFVLHFTYIYVIAQRQNNMAAGSMNTKKGRQLTRWAELLANTHRWSFVLGFVSGAVHRKSWELQYGLVELGVAYALQESTE